MKKVKIWPLSITIFFGCFFCAIVTFAVVIGSKRFDLVSPDYYDDEIAYQDRIDSITRTKELGETPTIAVEDDQVRLSFPSGFAPRVAEGKVHLYRPSDARQDLVVPLVLNAEGRQFVSLFGKPDGLWHVRVSWEMEAQSYYYEEPLVVNRP